MGCSEVAPTNPFDPNTPPSGQAAGRITGQLILPEGFAPSALAEATIALRDEQAPATVAYQVAPDADGAFVLADLLPTGYTLAVDAPGFTSDAIAVRIGPGSDINVGLIELRGNAEGAIEGVVQRGGAENHGGILVEIVGTPLAATSTAAGGFRLAAPAGEQRIAISATGYGTAEQTIQVEAGQTIVLEAPIVLLSEPGQITGTVQLGGDLGLPAVAVADAFVELQADDGSVAAQARPDDAGRFTFDAITTGAWRVVARRDGFVSRTVPARLLPGGATDVGVIELVPNPVSVLLEGRARRTGQPDHSGIRVSLRGTALATETDALGDYTLPAPLQAADYVLDFNTSGHNTEQAVAPAPGAAAVDAALTAGEVITLSPAPAEVALIGLPGRVRGSVLLAAGVDPAVLAQVSVRIVNVEAPDAVVAQRAPDGDGNYLFEDLPAATYQLRFALAGFAPRTRLADLEPGDNVVVESVTLSPDLVDARSEIEGIARRDCAGDCDHGGILVEVVGLPFVTVTGRDGLFRLDVVEGQDYTLSFSSPGYAAQTVAGVDAIVDEVTRVDDVLLPARPGRIRAIVRLEQLATPERLGDVQMGLFTDPPGDQPLRQASPDADGAVAFDDVLPGRYVLRASRAGYVTETQGVVIAPADDVFGGLFELQHLSTSAWAVPVEGDVLLADQDDHAGTRVRVRLVPDALVLGETVTDAAGRFTLPAAADERYAVEIVRAGYADTEDPGVLAWRGERFENDAGQPVAVTLLRAPIDGRISLDVGVAPGWLPARERWARVTVVGPSPRAREPVFTGGERVVFEDLAEGDYVVRVERAGFSTEQIALSLSQIEPQVDLGAITIELTDLEQARLDLAGQTIDACDLRVGIDAAGADLTGVVFTGNFARAEGCAPGATDGPIDLSDAILNQADLTAAVLGDGEAGAILDRARLRGADLSGVSARGISATRADFFAATALRTDWANADLRAADFTGARLTEARFVAAQLDADGTLMLDPASAWPDLGQPVDGLPARPCGADGPDVQLTGAILARADLQRAFMPGVNLDGVDLSRANLSSADLRFACLRGADLALLDLSGATLDAADATAAQFTGSILSRTALRGAILSNASLVNAVLETADLRTLPGCEALPDFEAYDDGGACAGDAPAADCLCRTRLDNANLDGANLAGSALVGVDLIGVRLRGAIIGEANGVGLVQPSGCHPQSYYACRLAADYRQDCPREGQELSGDIPNLADLDAFIDLCERTASDHIGELDGRLTSSWINNAQCIEEHADECIPDEDICRALDPLAPQWASPCTWDTLVAAGGDPIAAGCVNGAGQPWLHSGCSVAQTTLQNVRLDGADLVGAVLNRLQIEDVSFRAARLEGVIFVDNSFDGVDFTEASMQSAVLNQADLSGEIFVGADLRNAQLRDANLARADLTGANLTDADVTDAYFVLARAPATFRRARIVSATLNMADMTNVDFAFAEIIGGNIRGDMAGAVFSEGALSNVTLQTAGQGDEAADTRFNSTRFDSVWINGSMPGAQFYDAVIDNLRIGVDQALPPSLVGAIFQSIEGRGLDVASGDLTDASFAGCDLTESVFARATLAGTRMDRITLTDSDFTDATFDGACTQRADLRRNIWDGATFINTDVLQVDFTGGSFVGADLTAACNVPNAVFDDADLEDARICAAALVFLNDRYDYRGTPLAVDCSQDPAPVCPARCF